MDLDRYGSKESWVTNPAIPWRNSIYQKNPHVRYTIYKFNVCNPEVFNTYINIH